MGNSECYGNSRNYYSIGHEDRRTFFEKSQTNWEINNCEHKQSAAFNVAFTMPLHCTMGLNPKLTRLVKLLNLKFSSGLLKRYQKFIQEVFNEGAFKWQPLSFWSPAFRLGWAPEEPDKDIHGDDNSHLFFWSLIVIVLMITSYLRPSRWWLCICWYAWPSDIYKS